MTAACSSEDIYRPCVGIAIFNTAGQVFVGERIDTPGAWQMPQGGIDQGEELDKAAFRELAEETAITNAQIIRHAPTTVKYDLPDTLRKKLWNSKYRGQEQHWVAMRFLGKDQDINLDAFEHPEFRAWKWVDLQMTVELIVPFKRESYKQVIKFFKDIPNI